MTAGGERAQSGNRAEPGAAGMSEGASGADASQANTATYENPESTTGTQSQPAASWRHTPPFHGGAPADATVSSAIAEEQLPEPDDIVPSKDQLRASLRAQDVLGIRAIAVAQAAICIFILILHLSANMSSGIIGVPKVVFESLFMGRDLTLISLNDLPVNFWVVSALSGLILTSVLRYLLAARENLPEFGLDILTAFEMSLFLWVIWTYQYAYDQPAGAVLKSPTFVLIFVLIAMRLFRLHPRPIIVMGAMAAIGWTAMTIAAVIVDGNGAITRSYAEYIASTKILLGAQIEKIAAIAMFTAFLAIAAGRARQLLSKATHSDDYAAAVETAKHHLEEARAAERAKAEFLANMSHELRTPMNGVLGMTEVLMKTELSKKQLEFATIISQSGSALLTIINDILDFSKIEAGKLELEASGFNLKSAIEDVVTLLSSDNRANGLEVIFRYGPGLPEYVIGDAGRLRQVVTNLIGNAIKFTSEGHVLVEVDGEVHREAGSARVRINVRDTGIGIKPEEVQRIFDKFEQADNSSTRRYQGTGLGLAISKRLVKAMGGELGVSSVFGEGSTFHIELELPLADIAQGDLLPPPHLAGVRVLMADDIAANCRIVCEHLNRWNMRPVETTNPLKVIEMLRHAFSEGDPVKLVMLDYAMPQLTGFDLARAIKADPELSKTAVILLTSPGHLGDGKPLRDIGIEGYLIKPLRSRALLETISSVLQVAAGQETPPPAPQPGVPSPLIAANPAPAASSAAPNPQSHIPGQATPPPSAMPAGQMDRARPKILLIEDNNANRQLVIEMFAGDECDVIAAVDGEIGVRKFDAERPDLVFMDISMPRLDGYEAARAIRRLETERGLIRTPIIALTAHALPGERERCLGAGMDDYLPKPVRYDDLHAKYRLWLDRAAHLRAQAQKPPRARTIKVQPVTNRRASDR